MIVLIDNYDSFVFNLARYFERSKTAEQDFIPEEDDGRFNVSFRAPLGTTIEASHLEMSSPEQVLANSGLSSDRYAPATARSPVWVETEAM